MKMAEYKASVAHDLWSFGVVLYHLCYGKPLWKTDTDDNLSLEDLRKLSTITRDMLDGELYIDYEASNNPKTARDLISKLLEPDPSTRISLFRGPPNRPLKAALDKHPFFQGKPLEDEALASINAQLSNQGAKIDRIEKNTIIIAERTKTIEGLQQETIQRLNEHASSLRACIQVRAAMHWPQPRRASHTVLVRACATCTGHTFPVRVTCAPVPFRTRLMTTFRLRS